MRILLTLLLLAAGAHSPAADRLAPIDAANWGHAAAAHLLERAGFGGTPEEVRQIASLTPRQAVRSLVYFDSVAPQTLEPFEHSGIFDEGLDPFPPSRPATTRLAQATGEALGIRVREGGARPLQPIVNKFFYWLRASRLETDRVAQWWAERMLTTNRPLQEKIALFWHGHFATSEDKVRDYRKMLQQLRLFQHHGLGNFGDLLLRTAQDPAMLAYLDAGVNVKGSPNENFAREIMELFSMGVGHYTEQDIREAARAFTGWNFQGTRFSADASRHDDGVKRFLGHEGRFSGQEVIQLILAHDATPEFIATKLYRFFVSEDVDEELATALGDLLRKHDYALQPFLEVLFMSRAFHDRSTVGRHIKSPVEFVISTYRKLGLTNLPGAPDFNEVTGALGQHLFHPPTVAGWSSGRSWITPSLLMERGNFALNLMFPDIEFVPGDRYPAYGTGEQIRAVHRRLRQGENIARATRPADADTDGGMLAASNDVNTEEAFNTRYGSYRGWQMAIERVKPIERDLAPIRLTKLVLERELTTSREVVDHLAQRFFSVPLAEDVLASLAKALAERLGSDDIQAHATSLEEPLRVILHMLLSRPEYQLG